MSTSKAAVVISVIMGKVRSIIGYALVVVLGLPLVMGAYGSDIGVYVFVIVIILIGVLLIVSGARAKRRIKRFKRYVALISGEHMTSLQNLASATSQSIDFVKNDLYKMINMKFFTSASIDITAGEIIIGNRTQATVLATDNAKNQNIPNEIEIVNCLGCGATNSKQKGKPGNCEYCGTALK
jgi:ABC-type multidrug transport system fused ATPase/permease subunit